MQFLTLIYADETGWDSLTAEEKEGAYDQYRAWGAHGKTTQLRTDHPFLRDVERERQGPETRHGSTVKPTTRPSTSTTLTASAATSIDNLDLIAVLEASRAMSSETNLDRLQVQAGDRDGQARLVDGGDVGSIEQRLTSLHRGLLVVAADAGTDGRMEVGAGDRSRQSHVGPLQRLDLFSPVTGGLGQRLGR